MRSIIRLHLVGTLLLALIPAQAQWAGFEQVLAIDSGLGSANFRLDPSFVTHLHVGGAAAGDVNNNGHIDLVLLRGEFSPQLFINQGNGKFSNATAASGLGQIDGIPNGAMLVDVTGNGALDLLIGGVREAQNPEAPKTPMRLFLNDGTGQFSDATESSGLESALDSHSMALADIDGNGMLDLVVAYWQPDGDPVSVNGHLWRNLGNGQFEDISLASGIGQYYSESLFNFTPNFVDLNNNGRPDLLMAADFGHSRVFINHGDGQFVDATTSVISDENGMGATVGDFFNSGSMDWFVTSIFDDEPSEIFGTSGNRLYANDGSAIFEDRTSSTGTRNGRWGWGSCAADFNNDGWLDIFMVNGYQTHAPRFVNDAAQLFMNNGDGTFTESAIDRGLVATGQGRAVVCFDSNNNGQIDVLIQNHHTIDVYSISPQLFRNLGHPSHHWLRIRARASGPNSHAVGARLTLEAGGRTQTREIRAGNNFLSSDPIEAHFGLGKATQADRLTIRWPDGSVETLENIAANQILTITNNAIFRDHFLQ
jgi:enediyne biosynthesis protein E4